MLLSTKNTMPIEHSTRMLLKGVSYKDGKAVHEFIFNKKKLIVGSAPQADIRLEDPSISFYHAIIILDLDEKETNGTIIDLNSHNGTYVSGEKTSTGRFHPGDRLQFGMVEFYIEESFGQAPLDQDAGLVQTLSQKVVEQRPVELRPIQGLQIIDGEYADIVFDESAYRPCRELPVVENLLNIRDAFIEANDGVTEEDKQILNIFKKSGHSALEVTVVSSHCILSIDYFPLKVGKIILSNRKKGPHYIVSGTLDEYTEDITLAHVKSGEVFLHEAGDHEFSIIRGQGQLPDRTYKLCDNDLVSYSKKSVQIFIRLTDAPDKIIPPPFFGRDAQFKKQAIKYFSIFMGLMLLLMFVRQPEQVIQDKIAVIYKRGQKAVAAKNLSKNSEFDTQTGNKAFDQGKKENVMSKAGTPKEAQVAQAKPQAASQKQGVSGQQKAASPVSTYKLEISGGLSSFLNSKSTVSADVKGAVGGSTVGNSDSTGTSNTNMAVGKASAEIGNFGSDAFGTARGSSGTKGLSNKSGSDLLYVEPKTVILGSMDPDLLRKILQEYLPQFRHCYQQELAQNSEDIKGIVDLFFRIGEDGKVGSTTIKAHDARFSNNGRDCMAQVLKLIDFPKPKGGGVVDVRQPLNFFAEKGKI